MSSIINYRVELEAFRTGTAFYGVESGKRARAFYKLDDCDRTPHKMNLYVPEGTTAFNPSFYIGLFLDSIKNLGPEAFNDKYDIIFLEKDPEILKILKASLEDGKRNIN